ncbi:MAG: TonB-dependent receptor [Myxococcales bacterium]|nr:TonB-dependent receptor [Myxococcales bacterium]
MRSLQLCAVLLPLLLGGAARADEAGRLRGIVFDAAGAPLADVDVVVGASARATTNRDGAYSLRLPPGKHTVSVVRKSRMVNATTVEIVAGETTEVLLSFTRTGGVRADVETPARQAQRARQRQRRRALGPLGAVRGRIVDGKTRRPVVGARVFARGTNAEARTGADGRFVMSLAAGRHELTVIHPRYATEQVQALAVVVGPTHIAPELTISLAPAAVALADFTVTAPKITGNAAELLTERRKSTTVSELIGADQMSKSGDSDAASALSRVTGITVVGGKYVYVRGLGERYSATLLDGSTLPSPEPERRVVPLDMFPAGALESIVIQKAYSPDLPGEFGGGVVRLRTRGYPSKRVANITLTMGLNTVSSFRSGIGYGGESLDVLGFGASARRIPDAVASRIAGQPVGIKDPVLGGGFSGAELEQFGEAFKNQWNTLKHRLWPDLGIGLTLGDQLRFGGGHKAGYLFAASYDNSWQRRIRDDLRFTRLGTGGVLETFTNYRSEEIENSVTLSAIGSLGFDSAGGHKIKLSAMLARISDNETRELSGFDDNAGTNTRLTRLRYVERMLLMGQLGGTHPLRVLDKDGARLGVELGWHYALSLATRDEPDRREYRYDEIVTEPGTFIFSNRPGGNQRFFSELSDVNHDLGADLTLRFHHWSSLVTKIKSGVAVMLKDREVDTRRFQYLNRGPLAQDRDVLVLSPEQVLSPANIGEEGFRFSEGTRASDNYLAKQRLWAIYALVDLPLTKHITLSSGARIESSKQVVTTYELFTGDKVEAIVDKLDVLPAVMLSYRPHEKHVLRLGVSQIVSRPEFRELSPAGFTAVTGNKLITGNPDLQRALLQNVDLRWEWYPRRAESISVAVFYKHFDQPIEQIIEPAGGSQQILAPANAEQANNIGVEIELRKRLDFIHPALRDLTFSGNASFIFSRVVLGDGGLQTDKTRPLQGQSPWVFNTFLSYDNADSGTSARLLYNVYGPRIAEVGAQGLPNIVEQPFHQLDFVFRQRLSKNLSLAFKAKNLIDQRLTFTQENPVDGEKLVVDGYRRGRVFSISLTGTL